MKNFFNRVNKAMHQAKGGVRLWDAGYITGINRASSWRPDNADRAAMGSLGEKRTNHPGT